ncbi:unnamed protein product [Sphagnum troendelagicum]|uniref:Uncharacterized protein n=1 Tax=Sphagnum troendelagicum TaxID=128251 RepID=A0ABP0TVY7_9BRYO
MIRKLLTLLSRPPARLCRGKGAQRAQVGRGDEAGKEGRSGGRLNSRTYLVMPSIACKWRQPHFAEL